MRIAASLVFVALASFGIFSILKKSDTNQIAEQKPVEQHTPHNDDSNSTTDVLVPADDIEVAGEEKHDRSVPNKVTIPTVDETITTTKAESHRETTIPHVETVAESLEVTDDQSIAVDETIAQDDTPKNFKLVIEAGEVNEKYLTKRTVAKATSQDDNSSGIKKLLDKANDLKNNQDPFGDLRHMKDEILALNFQSNKKQEQNK